MLKEFKEFAVKGNVVDLAVGVVIGGALTGGVNFTYLKFVIKGAHGNVPAVTLNYGNFIQNSIDFLIVSFSIFLFIKLINKLKREKKVEIVETEPNPSEEALLLREIRDLLQK